jgi:hypothetical protein
VLGTFLLAETSLNQSQSKLRKPGLATMRGFAATLGKLSFEQVPASCNGTHVVRYRRFTKIAVS